MKEMLNNKIRQEFINTGIFIIKLLLVFGNNKSKEDKGNYFYNFLLKI